MPGGAGDRGKHSPRHCRGGWLGTLADRGVREILEWPPLAGEVEIMGVARLGSRLRSLGWLHGCWCSQDAGAGLKTGLPELYSLSSPAPSVFWDGHRGHF